MDIKNQRRDAATNTDPEGMYPGGKGHGSAASDNNIGWDVRAQSWQRGADTCYRSIQDENRENLERFGVPCADVLPNPADSNSDGNATLSNPHNFSNNPGFSVREVPAGRFERAAPANMPTAITTGPARFAPRGGLLTSAIKAGAEKLGGAPFQELPQ
jgi:hypothetical protein